MGSIWGRFIWNASRFQHLLVVSHIDADETVRIFSTREVTKHERGIHENG